MSRLTRSEIETLIDDLIVAHPIYTPQLRALRDQSLSQEAVRWKCGLCGGLIVNGRCSQCNFDYRPAAPKRQESVRDEALEPLADNERNADIEDFRKAVTYFRMTGKVPQGYSQAVFTEQVGDFALRYIRAVLKREPNAAAQAGQDFSSAPSNEGHAAGPAPTAPDVAEMVERLQKFYMEESKPGDMLCMEAAALLAKLGQDAPLSTDYIQAVPDKCDRIVWRGRYYHLPLKPGASDD